MKQQNVGDKVLFFPSRIQEVKPQLPEGKESIEATITSTHDKSCDLVIEGIEENPVEVLSVQHRSAANEENACWDFIEEVEE